MFPLTAGWEFWSYQMCRSELIQEQQHEMKIRPQDAMLNSLHLLLFWEVNESRHLKKETTVEQKNTG